MSPFPILLARTDPERCLREGWGSSISHEAYSRASLSQTCLLHQILLLQPCNRKHILLGSIGLFYPLHEQMVTLDLCPAQSWDRHLWCVYSSTAASLSHHRHCLWGFLDSPGEDSNACSVEHSAPRAKLPSPTEWSCCSHHGWAFSVFYFCKFAERISTYRSQGTIVVLCKPDRPPEHFSVILFLITGLTFSTQPLIPALHQ